MCLGIPAKINKISGERAEISIGGIKKEIALDILDEDIAVGDYIIVHSGFALKKIDEEECENTLKLLEGIDNEAHR